MTRRTLYWFLSVIAAHAALGAWLAFNPPAVPLALLPNGGAETTLQLWARYTARISFIYFFFTFIASPLRSFIKNDTTRFIRQNRRELGLAFALSHTIHLVALAMVVAANPAQYEGAAEVFIVGGAAYATMFIMAATSNQWGYARLGANWGRLHKFGIHFLALIFAFVYIGKTAADPSPTHIALLSALVLCYILRIADFIKRRRQS